MSAVYGRRRAAVAGSIALTLAGGLMTQSGAAPLTVAVKDDKYDDRVVTRGVGGQVKWSTAAGTEKEHNVRENSFLFDSGEPKPPAWSFTRTFSAGTFHYYCDIHGSPRGGMDGLVKVPVKITEGPDGRPFTVQWATAGSNTGRRFDVQFRIGTGNWRNWKRNATANKGVFGSGGRPVTVQQHKTYKFRAKSRNNTGASKWSPVRSKVVHY